MKVIVVSHGDFAKGILSSVQMLLGPQEKLVAHMCVKPSEHYKFEHITGTVIYVNRILEMAQGMDEEED